MSNTDIIERMLNDLTDEQCRISERVAIALAEQVQINDLVREELQRLSTEVINLRSMIKELTG